MSNEVTTMTKTAVSNPYEASAVGNKNMTTSGGTQVEMQRAMIETMTKYEVAKRFPRELRIVADRILIECERPKLAEKAVYEFPRGKELITGPTIRLMESIARSMGNINFGWQCLESDGQKSMIRAYAYDLENNTSRETTFPVKHWRDTKSGGYALKDERDIYELQANMAMRRVRGCLEGLVPRDLIDMALEKCEETAKANIDTSAEGLAKILTAFEKFGINKAMIEDRFAGMKMEAIRAPQIIALRRTIAALKEGVAKPEDAFNMDLADPKSDGPGTGGPDLKAEIAKKQAEGTVTATTTSPVTGETQNQTVKQAENRAADAPKEEPAQSEKKPGKKDQAAAQPETKAEPATEEKGVDPLFTEIKTKLENAPDGGTVFDLWTVDYKDDLKILTPYDRKALEDLYKARSRHFEQDGQ